MNNKELGELRRRLTPEKTSISELYGCFVNGNGEIVSLFRHSLASLEKEEAARYMLLLRKVITGRLGQTLMDIVFETSQVQSSEEHGLLMRLRDSMLSDEEARTEYFKKLAGQINMKEENYCILLAADRYDVPSKHKDSLLRDDDSDNVYTYILSAVCPVRSGKVELSYNPEDKVFHSSSTGLAMADPEVGFLFPAFDDRMANIYNALLYLHTPADPHQDLVDALFHTDPILTAPRQNESFQTALAEGLGEECSLDVMKSLHTALCDKIVEHKESHSPEILEITAHDVADILEETGVTGEKVTAFREACRNEFGGEPVLQVSNLVGTGRIEMRTPQCKIQVSSDFESQIEEKMLGGRRYLLIPIDEGVLFNGVDCKTAFPEKDESSSPEG